MRATVVALALVASVTGVAWAGRAIEGRRALGEAEHALARSDTTEAILAARAAAEARCPFCSAPDAGFAKLETIARDAEKRGDDATAFAAWRAVRSATLGSAVFGVRGDRRTRAELELGRLGHRVEAAAGGEPSPAAAEDRLRNALARETPPAGSTFLVIGVGGLVFAAFAWRFARETGSRRDAALAATGAALAAAGAFLF